MYRNFDAGMSELGFGLLSTQLLTEPVSLFELHTIRSSNGSFEYLDNDFAVFSNALIEMTDDYAGDTSTTGIAPLDGTVVTGVIETAGDSDWFKVDTSSANITTLFSLSTLSGNLNEINLSIYDQAGVEIDLFDLLLDGTELYYTFETSGTYFVGLSNPFEDGGYEFSFTTVIDDYASSTSTSGVVNLGSATTGTHEYGGDTDWFRLDLVAGETYEIFIPASSNFRFTLLDASGNLDSSTVDSNVFVGNGEIWTINAQTSQTVFVNAIHSLNGQVLPQEYAFQANLVTPFTDDHSDMINASATLLSGTESAIGEISSFSETDVFRFRLDSSETHRFQSAEGVDFELFVNSTTGVWDHGDLTYGTDPNTGLSYLEFTPDTTRVFYMVVSYTDIGSFPYGYEVTHSTDTAPPPIVDDHANDTTTTSVIALDGISVSGIIEEAADEDWFRLEIAQDDTVVEFTLDSLAGDLTRLDLDLYNSSGGLIITNFLQDAGQYFSFHFTTAGTYYVNANNFSETGNYAFNAVENIDLYSADVSTTGLVIVDGASISGEIQTSEDVDWIRIDGAMAADTIIVTALEVLDQTGQPIPISPHFSLIVVDDMGVATTYEFSDGDFTNGASIELPDHGAGASYYLELKSNELGDIYPYEFTVSSLLDDYPGDASTTELLKNAVLVSGSIISETDSDWFAFDAVAGEALAFQLLYDDPFNNGYAYMTIRDANGVEIESFRYNDRFALFENFVRSQITIIPEHTETLYVDVSFHPNVTFTGEQNYALVLLDTDVPDSVVPFLPAGWSPWTAIPDVVARPAVEPLGNEGDIFRPVGDVVIGPDEVVFQSHEYGLTAVALSETDSTLVNQGLIYVEDGLDFIANDSGVQQSGSWAYGVVTGNGDSFRNEGDIVAISSLYNAAGVFWFTGFTAFENTGTITAISFLGSALGAEVLGGSNSGTIQAWSESIATGVAMAGSVFVNNGLIRSEGYAASNGIEFSSSTNIFTNNGQLVSRSVDTLSAGVIAIAPNGVGGNNVESLTVINTGLIDADYAIYSPQDVGPDDRFTDIDNSGTIIGSIILGAGNDTVINDGQITGDILLFGGSDLFDGSNGQLIGLVFLGEGDDEAIGGSNDDILIGDAGNDILNGGLGADTLDGGDGYDFAVYSDATERVWMDLQGNVASRGEAVGDILVNIEGLIGSVWSDQLRGDSGANELYGGGRSDRLYGRAGDDILNGEGGADAIYGNRGTDVMTGGDDTVRDRFIFFQLNDSGLGTGNRDIITDFTSGEDRIEISRFDANTSIGGNQIFDFIADAGFSNTAGELRYEKAGGITLIQADVDGDGVADFELELVGEMDLIASDFLL